MDPESDGLLQRFETVNTEFLQTMSAWQQTDVGGHKATNDDSDPDYDDKVITRAAKLVQRLGPRGRAGRARSALPPLPRRFAVALDRIDAASTSDISSPMPDSVHNIWLQFHEDLLRTQGRARTE